MNYAAAPAFSAKKSKQATTNIIQKRGEDFFEFLASAASIVSCFGRTEGHALDLCVKVVSLEFFTHTYGEAKEKKI